MDFDPFTDPNVWVWPARDVSGSWNKTKREDKYFLVCFCVCFVLFLCVVLCVLFLCVLFLCVLLS